MWSRQTIGWVGKSEKYIAFIWCGCNGKDWWWQVYRRIKGKDQHSDYFNVELLAGDDDAANWQQAKARSEKSVPA